MDPMTPPATPVPKKRTPREAGHMPLANTIHAGLGPVPADRRRQVRDRARDVLTDPDALALVRAADKLGSVTTDRWNTAARFAELDLG